MNQIKTKMCKCGKVAYKRKDCDWICERCDRIEHSRVERKSYYSRPGSGLYDIWDYGVLRLGYFKTIYE